MLFHCAGKMLDVQNVSDCRRQDNPEAFSYSHFCRKPYVTKENTLYVNSPAQFFCFLSISSFPGGQVCTVVAYTPGFHPTHARCCSPANRPCFQMLNHHSLCKTGFQTKPLLKCICTVAVQCLFCSHLNTVHSNHCGSSKEKERGATLMVIQMCSSAYLVKSELFLCCKLSLCTVLVSDMENCWKMGREEQSFS